MSTPSTPLRERTGAPVGELGFAAAVAGLGVFALVRATAIQEPLAGGALGPRTLPYIIGTMLVVLGAIIFVSILLGHRGEAEQSEDLDTDAGTHWLTIGSLIVLFVLHAFLIVPLGWPVAAAVLFIGAAVTFGARPYWKAILIGTAMAFLVQLVFAGLLGVSLPAGPLFEGVTLLRG